jgi:succinyl-diaminopimelate desuccinylase
MNTNELLEKTKELIAIPSVTKDLKNTRKAYDYMVHYLKERTKSKDVTLEEFEKNGIPSFLAYRGKKRPDNFRVLFNAHIDVVDAKPQQFKAKIKDGKLYGRGSHDMKAAAVILADAFAEYVDKVPYALGYQVVTDEEVGGYDGALHQIEQGVRADFVVCGECGRQTHAYEIANEAKGIVFTEVVFRGRAGHGAYPWRNNSPITKATKFIEELHRRFPIPTEPYEGTTISVTGFHADGGAYTRIPDIATIRLDGRFVPGDPNFRSKAHFAALIEEIDPEAELQNFNMNAPLYSDPKNPLLLSLKASAEKVEGAKFSFVRRHATSDGRHYGEVGDQACEFGIAGEHQHGDEEHVTIEAFENYRNTMHDFLEKTIESEKKHTHTKAFKD